MATNIANSPKMTELLTEKYPEYAAALAASRPFLAQMGQLGPQGEALMGALSAGFQGSDITFNNAEAVGAVGSQLPIRDVTTSAIEAGQVGPQQQITAQQIKAAQMGPIAAVKGPAGYTPQQVQAIQAQRVADISANQVQSGALGSQLMSEAQRRVSLNGQLSPEATRDAIQSARQGFAARGMATGNAALGAELLNRDRYSRQRGLEDLQFAQGVQGADITRQQANQDASLRASTANQSTASGLSLANQSAGMNAQQLNQAAGARSAEFLQSGELQAGLANAQTAYNTGQTNAQLANQGVLANQDADLRAQAANQGTTLSAGTVQAQLGSQASIAAAGNNLAAGQSNQSADLNVFGQDNNMSQFNAGNQTQNNQFNSTGNFNQSGAQAGNNRANNSQNLNALGGAYSLGQGVIQGGLAAAGIEGTLAGAANPNAMLMNMYNGQRPVGSESIAGAVSLANNWANNETETSGFNSNGQNWVNASNMAAPQASGGGYNATGALIGGSVAGGLALAIPGGAPFAPYAFGAGSAVGGQIRSDKRLKKNIKDNEYGLEDIAKLKTYQYDYKDGADNEAGVMAQELRKVMPEAVTEAEMMDGKKKVKRLMIKPMFLTAALVNSVKELNDKVAALGSSFTSKKQKPKPMALGDALMELV
jgi:hypothetical protein